MRNLSRIICIASTLGILPITSVSNAADVGSNFSGKWCWDKNSKVGTFSLVINKVSNVYKGGYSCVAYSGDKIDDNDNAFSFKATKKNKIKTKLKAGISGESGLIYLEILNDNKIKWIVVKEPKGEFYPPETAILHRCDG